jgi:hypothetical protein
MEEQSTANPTSPTEPHINFVNDSSDKVIVSEPVENAIMDSSRTSSRRGSSSAIVPDAIVANNDLPQAHIGETMESITQSEGWKQLDEYYKRKEAEAAKLPKGIDVIFDSDSDPKDKLVLLRLLFDARNRIREGLVLMRLVT